MKTIIIILALICGSTVAFAQAEPVSLRDQLKHAEQLVNTGHRSEALKELHAIASSDVFDPQGFYNLGNSFARLGETEAALTAYRRAIEQRRGKYSRALNNMGVVLLRAGRWDEAYDSLIAALQIERFRYAEASYNLGRVYAARGQSDLAAREWRRALRIDPEHDAAKLALAGARDEERIVVVASKPAAAPKPVAVAEAKPASIGKPKTLSLDQMSYDFLQRAREASEHGKMTEAVENFRRVLNRQGGYFAPANLELSYVLLSLKRYDEALGNLVQVSTRDGARYPISYFHLAHVRSKRRSQERRSSFLTGNRRLHADQCPVSSRSGACAGKTGRLQGRARRARTLRRGNAGAGTETHMVRSAAGRTAIEDQVTQSLFSGRM
jgi:tetratricopeptide (TPR) repeat protein